MLESVLFHRDWSKNNRHGLIACVCHAMVFLLFSVGSVLDFRSVRSPLLACIYQCCNWLGGSAQLCCLQQIWYLEKMKMSSYWKACLVSALTHGLGFVLFVVANEIAHHFYLLWNGGFGSRGIAPGAVFYLVLLVFSVANLLVVFVPVRKVKYGISVVFSLATAALLLPQHPIRALFYVASGWLVIVVCICASSWLSNKFAYEGGR